MISTATGGAVTRVCATSISTSQTFFSESQPCPARRLARPVSAPDSMVAYNYAYPAHQLIADFCGFSDVELHAIAGGCQPRRESVDVYSRGVQMEERTID